MWRSDCFKIMISLIKLQNLPHCLNFPSHAGERQRMVLEELEHPLLGDWLHFRLHAWRGLFSSCKFKILISLSRMRNDSLSQWSKTCWGCVNRRRAKTIRWWNEKCRLFLHLSSPTSPHPGNHCVQHHVHRGAVPKVPEGALEVPKDCR